MCIREMAPWMGRRPVYADALAEYEEYNATRESTFLLRLDNGRVRILDKPRFYTRAQLDAEESPDPLVNAAIAYRDLMQPIVAASCRDIDTVMALDLDDGGLGSDTTPIFVIQKLAGSSAVLLPHYDFPLSGFHGSCQDDIGYWDKALRASFIGATTGGGHFTAESVRNLAFPRLRSAMFFKDHPLVDFRLTKIVQCSAEAERLLREMGFGTGECPFEEHFANKFIISIDGNAGTCARMTLALKSNCVPLKYDSQHMMHYSSHLVPWLHYIPIGCDTEVETVLELERNHPGLFEYIARTGTRFFESYLTDQRIMEYLTGLIRLYGVCFEPPWLRHRSC